VTSTPLTHSLTRSLTHPPQPPKNSFSHAHLSIHSLSPSFPKLVKSPKPSFCRQRRTKYLYFSTPTKPKL
jgi:hypothetical protein